MGTPKKILVTGSNGQVGSELKELASAYPDLAFTFLTRAELSLDDTAVIAESIARYKPDVVVNCAAYTAVDKAETEPENAYQINAEAVGAMAKACAEAGAMFLHISTDYVFDGSRQTPLKENDSVSPINVYGESKLAGEESAQRNNPDSIIIRTSWVYSVYGKNFVKTMMRLMGEKDSISVVNDQWGSPTYAADLAKAILHIVQTAPWRPGIYHFSNEGVITWFEFANEIASVLQSSCKVLATTTANFPTPARRPAYSVMDKAKIQQGYGIPLEDWKESLRICLGKMRNNPPV